MKKKNRKMRKALLIVCCALALVAISVGATIAYLTDTESVTNTFSVGQVGISLDEADTDNSTEGDNDRDTANAYHLIPGQTYIKDPTVHVDANSEPSWLFVKVENGISEIEIKTETETEKTIASQIAANGWTELTNVDNVYYRKHETKQNDVKDYVVFSNFTIDGESVTNTEIDDYETASVKVTAYAIQMAGFDSAEKTEAENAAEAWAAGEWN